MAQHDYNLSNNTGALYRADNNAALQAIVTQNSGASAPSVTFPGMLWLDLSGGGDGVMRRRNQANNAWLTDIGIDQTARNAAAAAQATADAAMPKAGGTFTGPINLPTTVPTNNQAVSRAQGDLLYQVVLPATQAGALLYGLAGGWTGVLAPAANDTVLVLSGGLPTWAAGAVTAVPNAYVRTRSDGTIDPTLIPSVASGLRFRGTFKPAVNAEYPTTGGSGSGGAPAVGDFWVIDGLTTGGYTYLTGSLAGVTVYNGDSIAKSDGTSWYRMGSSVELEGYLKADGSTAMTGNLNMAAHNIINIAGLTARAGPAVPLSNFSLDATNIIISPQRGTTGADLPAMATGQIGTDLGRMQIFVGAGASNTGLLPVRFFSATNAYAIGEYVVEPGTGAQYRANQAISAGAFTASQWSRVMDENFATFRVAVRSTSFAADQNATMGKVYLQQGTTTQPGYVDIVTADNTRRAIFGASDGGTNVVLGIYNGWGLRIQGTGTVTMQQPLIVEGAITSRLAVTARSADNVGYAQIYTGNASNPGYVAFFDAGNTRTGYIGWTGLQPGGGPMLAGDNGRSWGCNTPMFFESYIQTKGPLQIYNDFAIQSTKMRYGWSDNITRLAWVMEADTTLSLYSYNASGGNPTPHINFQVTNSGKPNVTIFNSHQLPWTDNSYNLGNGAQRWYSVYAVVGTIQTCDEREKTPFTPFTPAELGLGTAIIRAAGSYQWLADLDKGSARVYFGAGAQTVAQLFVDAGLDPVQFATLTKDTWEAQEEVTNDEGTVITPGREAGYRYGMNYDQVFMLGLAALEARITALESAQQETMQ